IARAAARRPRTLVMEDATRQALTFRRLMVGVTLLADQWRALLGPQVDERVGVLLPNVNATPVTVLSLWRADKVPAILNFSTGAPTMLTCAQLAGLKWIVTSKLFEERGHLNLQPFREAGIRIVYLEDVRGSISGLAQFGALVSQWLAPRAKARDPRSE